MSVDFRSLLSAPADSFEAPKALPPGSYSGRIKSHEFGESAQKKTPYVRFHLAVTNAIDVDPSELSGIDLSKKSLRVDFYLTTDAAYRLRSFLDGCGISTKGRSLGECIPETSGASVIMEVTQRKTEKDTYNDVKDIKGQ